jgi:hypothetical protein
MSPSPAEMARAEAVYRDEPRPRAFEAATTTSWAIDEGCLVCWAVLALATVPDYDGLVAILPPSS